MIIELEELKNLGRLAKIKLKSEEQKRATSDLNDIMQMIAQMQNVDTSNVEPMANPLDASQRLRMDSVTETVEREDFQKLSEHTRDGFYTVPRVIE